MYSYLESVEGALLGGHLLLQLLPLISQPCDGLMLGPLCSLTRVCQASENLWWGTYE